MARPLRLEFAGALYHVTSRGDRWKKSTMMKGTDGTGLQCWKRFVLDSIGLYTLGLAEEPKWLDTEWLLNQFGDQRRKAIVAYRRFVMQGKGASSPLEQTRQSLFLGDESFVERYRNRPR